MARVQQEVTGWVGWVYFASMMMFIIGGLDIIAGLVGLFHKGFYVATQNGGWVIFNNYTAWGWINIIYGIILVLGGLSLTSGKVWARVFASILVVLNAIANLMVDFDFMRNFHLVLNAPDDKTQQEQQKPDCTHTDKQAFG